MTDTRSTTAAGAIRMPEPGSWAIDSVHSFVAFTIEHFTVAFARGIAAGPTGVIVIAEDVRQSTVQASIDVSTLTTANPARDEKITGPDVLDAARFPAIEFTSTRLRPAAPGRYALDGNLTIRDVTRAVTLDLIVHGVIADVWGKSRLGLTATTDIQRSDYGAGEWGHRALMSGGFMVPDAVSVTLEIEATREIAEAEPPPPAER
jgi:polyisoprenoid-binding protein YceI